MKNNLFFVTISILFIGCNSDNFKLKPKADFSYLCVGGFKVSFSNTSLYSTNLYWDFGDGTTSIEKAPLHLYNSKGPFIVKLRVSDEVKSDSINKTIIMNDIVSLNNIQVPPFPIAPIGIDVDFDGLIDFEFTYFNIWSHIGAYESSKVIPNNNYEMFIDSIKIKTWKTLMNSNDTTFSVDTFTFPRIYLFGDDISNESQIADKELIIAMFEHPSQNVFKYSSGYRLTNWIGDKIKYLGFRKVENNKVKIGWIKLKVLSFTNVTLISFKIPEEYTMLTIDK